MMRGALTILFLAMVFPLAVANAGGAENEFLSRVVGPLDRKGAFFACFVRQYDAAHLTAHPEQRVTFAKVLVDAYYRASFRLRTAATPTRSRSPSGSATVRKC